MSFYDYAVENDRGNKVDLASYRGKVLLIVNTASKCGFTPQLEGLQKLQEAYEAQGFTVLAFPSNQFAGQEPEDAASIRKFYQEKYQVTFPIMAKSAVNGRGALPLYQWLRRQRGSLFGRRIKWNFTKFLINSHGEVYARYAPSRAPAELTADIEKLLATE